MPREILIHLNVEVPESDTRSAEEISDAISGALEVGSDNEILEGISWQIPLAEDIGVFSHDNCEEIGICLCD